MHILYPEFEKAVNILKERGLNVQGPDGLVTTDPNPSPKEIERSKNSPTVWVTRTDWGSEYWIMIDAPEKSAKKPKVKCRACVFSPGDENYKSSTELERSITISSCADILAAYEKVVKEFVDEHNGDHDSLVKDLMDEGETRAKAESMAKPMTGGRWKYHPSDPLPNPDIRPDPVPLELQRERKKNDLLRKKENDIMKRAMRGEHVSDDEIKELENMRGF